MLEVVSFNSSQVKRPLFSTFGTVNIENDFHNIEKTFMTKISFISINNNNINNNNN